MVQGERDALAAAERRLTAAQDALASIPTDAPVDAMLDFANALRAAIKGRLDDTGSMAEINEALRDLFTHFTVREDAHLELVDNGHGGWRFKTDRSRTQLLVSPFLREGVAHRLSDEWPKLVATDEDAPPLRWLSAPVEDPAGKPHNSHEYLRTKWNSPACCASQA
jgi:hypothetical protein